MTYKHLGGIAVLLAILAFPASASMVSFQLVETGINERASSGQYSSLWESGLMAAFFDAGHIVTSSPVMRVEDTPASDFRSWFQESFNDAVEGGAAYFVLGFLEYDTRGGRALPVGIVLQVYDSNSGRLIYEQNFPAGTGGNNSEEFRLAQDAGRVIISHMKGR